MKRHSTTADDDAELMPTSLEDVQFLRRYFSRIFAFTERTPPSKKRLRKTLDFVNSDLGRKMEPAERERRVNQLYEAEIREAANYRNIRPPKGHQAAKRIVFGHDPQRQQRLFEDLTYLETVFAHSLCSKDRGRYGIILAVHLVGEFMNRLPLPKKERYKMLEPLRFLQDSLTALDRGYAVPALVPSPRQAGRPIATSTSEFKIRCALAVEAWSTLENDKPKAIKRVFAHAEATAKWLGCNPKGGFSKITIENWHKRHSANWNKWLAVGDHSNFDEKTSEIWQRDVLELYKDMSGYASDSKICKKNSGAWKPPSPQVLRRLPFEERTILHRAAIVYLEALKKGNIDRPMGVFWSAPVRVKG